MKKILFIILLCPLLAFAQPGWKTSSEANAITYLPTDLPANKKFKLKFYKIALGGLGKKNWLTQHAKKQQSTLGKTTRKWKIKREREGEWTASNKYISASGDKLFISYETGMLKNGEPYVYQIISSPDIGVMIEYGIRTTKLKPVAEKKLMDMQLPTLVAESAPKASKSKVSKKGSTGDSKSSKMSGKKGRQYVKKNIRTEPNQGVKLSAIEAVLVDVGYDAIRGKVTSYTYLLFKDGTVYGACTTPIRDLNIKASKELEQASLKWTRWKKQGGKYYFQNTKTKKWVLKKGLERALPGKKGLRLDNTFWTFSGSNILGLQTSHRGYYKFMPNGRFEISSFTMHGSDMGDAVPYVGTVSTSDKKGSQGTTMVSDDHISGGVTSKRKDGSKNTGTYYIDGYTIEFHHDNGWVHRELFHFPEKHGKTYIHINDEIYWIKEG